MVGKFQCLTVVWSAFRECRTRKDDRRSGADRAFPGIRGLDVDHRLGLLSEFLAPSPTGLWVLRSSDSVPFWSSTGTRGCAVGHGRGFSCPSAQRLHDPEAAQRQGRACRTRGSIARFRRGRGRPSCLARSRRDDLCGAGCKVLRGKAGRLERGPGPNKRFARGGSIRRNSRAPPRPGVSGDVGWQDARRALNPLARSDSREKSFQPGASRISGARKDSVGVMTPGQLSHIRMRVGDDLPLIRCWERPTPADTVSATRSTSRARKERPGDQCLVPVSPDHGRIEV